MESNLPNITRQSGAAGKENLALRESSGAFESFPAPLWYSQQLKWILEPETSDSVAYNFPIFLRIDGRLDPQILELALQELIRRHQVFRSNFHVSDGVQTQTIAPAGNLRLRKIDLSELESDARESLAHAAAKEEANRAFDLRFDLLLRSTLVQLTLDDHVLLLLTHHAICDDWSAKILFDELFELYSAYALGKTSPLPCLSSSYREFALQLSSRMRNGNFEVP